MKQSLNLREKFAANAQRANAAANRLPEVMSLWKYHSNNAIAKASNPRADKSLTTFVTVFAVFFEVIGCIVFIRKQFETNIGIPDLANTM